MDQNKYLSRKEAAALLKVSVHTLNAWSKKTHKNYIAFEKNFRRRSIYKLKDLEEFMKKNNYYV